MIKQILRMKDFGIEENLIENVTPNKIVLTTEKKILFDSPDAKYCKVGIYGEISNAGGYMVINDIIKVPINSVSVVEITTPVCLSVKLVVGAESSALVHEIYFEELPDKEYLSDQCVDSNNVLVVVPNYPSFVNLYLCAFAHSRNREYIKRGIHLQVAAISSSDWVETLYTIDGISVYQGGYESLKRLLKTRRYKTIVTHFVDENLFNIYDKYIYPTEELLFICHGPETIYRYLENIVRPYFTKPITKSRHEKIYAMRDRYIKRYSQMENAEWVFVSDWLKQFAEEQHKISFRNGRVINNVINESLFPYSPKEMEDRKHILIMRKFDNIIYHSIDQSVEAILALSKKDFFKDLTFDVYGDGDYWEVLTKPIKDFDNIRFHRTFIPNAQISEIHKKVGIMLIPSRQDAHAVAMGEAASSGLVVVGSRVTSNPYFMQEERFHTLADPEDPIELANIIERLYKNPEEFLKISKELSEFTRKNFCVSKTVEKEAVLIKKMIQSSEDHHIRFEKEKMVTPVLSIVVPTSNNEQSIEKCILSLLKNRYHYKMEIIIVNHGSTDGTLLICQDFEKRYGSIIKIINQVEKNYGAAVNDGAANARGRYLKVVNGSDWVDSTSLEKLIDILEKEESDLVLTNVLSESADCSFWKDLMDYVQLEEGKVYGLEDYDYKLFAPFLYAATYRTDCVQKVDDTLSREPFYCNLEFHSYAIQNVESMQAFFLDLYFYNGKEWDIHLKDHRIQRETLKNIVLNVLARMSECNFRPKNEKYLHKQIIAPIIDSLALVYEVSAAGTERKSLLEGLKKYPAAVENILEYYDKKKGKCRTISGSIRKYCRSIDEIIANSNKRRRKKMKALTILVPVYNTEKYIKRCLDTLLVPEVVEDIEVIVVSDGSKDGSVEIVKAYCEKYPQTVVLVDKENGGHGSTINVGIEKAQGTYFRVLDSDDWFNTTEFVEFVRRLKEESADVVICDYRKEHTYNSQSEYFVYKDLEDSHIYKFDEVDLKILNGEYFMMATTTYRTEVLRKSGLKMLEKTFYVDMQFNIVPITAVSTFVYYHMDIYRYFIGRREQSMNMDNFVRNQEHHKRMIKWLIEYYTNIAANLSPNKREYIEIIMTYTLNTHYSIYCQYDKNHKRAYEEIKEFDDYLLRTNKVLYDRLNCMAYVRYNRKTNFKFVRLNGKKWSTAMMLAKQVKGRIVK